MKLPRRRFLHLAVGVAALPALPIITRAQAYPSLPVRLIVGFPPGGPGDLTSRLVAQWLSERLGQPFVVDNRPGASGNIAMEAVVRSPPDGHTLVLLDATPTISTTLFDKLSFNFIRDIAPVAGVAEMPEFMVVNPSVPAKTVPEFIAYAKANPGKINMASAGNATPPHVAGELFKMMTGVNLAHIPYRGAGPAMTDLLGGQVQIAFFASFVSLEHVKSGKLRALAVTSAKRFDELPDIPTVGESVPGFEVSVWFGIGAPKNTPVDILDTLNREINVALVDPKIKARIAGLGATPLVLSPAAFRNLIASETEKWAKVIKFAGIKPE